MHVVYNKVDVVQVWSQWDDDNQAYIRTTFPFKQHIN